MSKPSKVIIRGMVEGALPLQKPLLPLSFEGEGD